jgi:hypothetical protein
VGCKAIYTALKKERAYKVSFGVAIQPEHRIIEEVIKSVWGMPRLSEAKKDVISCEKLRGSANRN